MDVRFKWLAAFSMVMILSVARLSAAGDMRLVNAAAKGSKEEIRSLLKEHVDVNTPQADGATALAWTVHRDDLETADLLIRAGPAIAPRHA